MLVEVEGLEFAKAEFLESLSETDDGSDSESSSVSHIDGLDIRNGIGFINNLPFALSSSFAAAAGEEEEGGRE